MNGKTWVDGFVWDIYCVGGGNIMGVLEGTSEM